MRQNSIRVRTGGWNCARYLKTPAFRLEGKDFCPRCGREVKERFWRRANQPAWTGLSHSRTHIGTFSTLDGC